MYKEIVLLAGVARSGTSWLGQILDSSPDVAYRFQPLFSYAFKGFLNYNSSKKEYINFFEGIYDSQDVFLLQKDKRQTNQYPSFSKNMNPRILVLKENRYQYIFPKMISLFDHIKMIGIIRHPCAVVNSWIQNPKEFPPGSEVDKEWRFGACKNQGKEEEFFGFYKWREISNLYLDLSEKFPEKVCIIKYNDLVDRTENKVEQIFNFLKIEIEPQTKNFINECNSKHVDGPYSVFKNKKVKDRWRDELNKSIIDEIYFELESTRLEKFLV
jgi:hypothetical protein